MFLKNKINEETLARIILLLAILIGFSLRTLLATRKANLFYDEATSYLTSTCHKDEYLQLVGDPQIGTFRPASEWKDYLKYDSFCPDQVASILSRHDIHPPLYFWILNVWVGLVDTHFWTGPLLNTMFAVMTALVLYKLAKDVLADSIDASIVVFIWAVSPALIMSSLLARHYVLLAFLSITFTFLILKGSDPSKGLRLHELLLLILIMTAGMLTHYHFFFLIVGGMLIASYRLFRSDNQRLLYILGAVGVVALIFVILNPTFLSNVIQARNQMAPYSSVELKQRVIKTVWQLIYFGQGEFKPLRLRVAGALLVLLSIAFMPIFLRYKSRFQFRITRPSPNESAILFLLLWTFGITVVTFLLFLGPSHAMSRPDYLALFWPYFAFVPVIVIKRLGKLKLPLALLICTWLTIASWNTVMNSSRINNGLPDKVAQVMHEIDGIVIDNMTIGEAFPLLWQIDDEILVLVDHPDQLIENVDEWQTPWLDRGMYISVAKTDEELQGRKAMLSMLKDSYDLSVYDVSDGDLFGIWDTQFTIFER